MPWRPNSGTESSEEGPAANALSPLRGEGWEWGCLLRAQAARSSALPLAPPPQPLPARGRGESLPADLRRGLQMSQQKIWRIGVAGLGTVGAGLLNFLSDRP